MATDMISPYPQPALPVALLPEEIRAKLSGDKSRHYPQQYLDQLKPLDSTAHKVILLDFTATLLYIPVVMSGSFLNIRTLN